MTLLYGNVTASSVNATILVSLISVVLLPVVTNVATGALPDSWQRFLWLAWPMAAGLAAAVLLLEGRRSRREAAIHMAAPSVVESSVVNQAMFQLPPDSAVFVGRQQELLRVHALMEGHFVSSATAVCAIAGPAGVGKTALAVHAAHQLRQKFPDGQLYVDLSGSSSEPSQPMAVLGDLLRGLGVAPAGIPDGLSERISLYRSMLAKLRVLVILDDAADETQVRALLPGGPACAVILTCRTVLAGVAGDGSLRLGVLEDGEAIELLGRICGGDRLAGQRDAAVRVVRSCGNLPLAICIVGAKLAAHWHRELAWMADRLADERRRLDELRFGQVEVRAGFLGSAAPIGDIRDGLPYGRPGRMSLCPSPTPVSSVTMSCGSPNRVMPA